MNHCRQTNLDYLILALITLLCALNIHQITTLNFETPSILRSLREWQNKENILLQLQSIVGLRKEVEELLSNFNELIDEQRYLLQKIKESFIQDNRELEDIPEIVRFRNKLHTFQSIQKQENQEFEKIEKQIHAIKNMQNRKANLDPSLFFKKANEVIQNMEALRKELRIVLQKNKKWHEQSSAQFSNKQKLSTETYSDQDIQDLPQYYNLVPLARQILRPLPLDFLKILYKSTSEFHEEPQLQIRQKYYKERVYIAKQNYQRPAFSLTKYNIRSALEILNWGNDIIHDYRLLDAKYSLSNFTQEKGICIVVPTYNNANSFRAQLNLNSIFAQNYTNYKVVIIDDFSTDGTPTIIQKYLKYYNIDKQKCQLIINNANKKAMNNIYYAILNNCQGYQIITLVDGDDELIGFNVLKVLNAVYSQQLLGVVYSNFYYYKHQILFVKEGISAEYNISEQQDYRGSKQKFSHLISFKKELFEEIKLQDLQQNGQFYSVAYDFAMLYPLMELSCKKVKYIEQFQYLYSIGTGANDYQIFSNEQREASQRILKKLPYKCSVKYSE